MKAQKFLSVFQRSPKKNWQKGGWMVYEKQQDHKVYSGRHPAFDSAFSGIFDRSAERMDMLYKEKKYYAVRKTYEDTIKEVTQHLNKYGIDYMPNYLMFNSDAKIGEATKCK
jgi:hypothetical protein